METGRLLERGHELVQLGDLAADAVGGSGRTIVVVGPPGVGKSSVLAAGRHLAERHPRLCTSSFVCGELEQELAWAAVTGLLTGPLSKLDGPGREAVLGGPVAAASRLFGHGGGLDGSVEPGDTYSVIHALFALVVALGERGPLILLLDDAHWADRSSLQFLVYLQRRLADQPVGLVVATRPPELAAERDLLERLIAGPATDVRIIRDLGPSSVTEIVHADGFPRAGSSFCAACWEVTRGNPFYLHELLRELRDDQVDPELGSEDLIRIPPPSVTRSVLVRLGRLPSPHAAELARVTAILGDGVALRHAAAMAGIEVAAAADALDALSAAELLGPEEPLRFVHPLVRAAVYADIAPARRAVYHAGAAELLAADGAPSEHVALHLLHAPRVASADTVRILREAASRAEAKGAPDAAARFLGRALQEPPEGPVRVEVLIQLAAAETAIGAPDAIPHLTEALELTRSPDARAALLLRLGWAEHQAGRFERAADAFEAGTALEPEPELAHQLEAGFLMSATLVRSRAKAAQERLEAIATLPSTAQAAHHRQVLAQVLFGRTVTGAPRDGIIELALRLWDDGRMLSEDGPASEALWHVIGALSWADAYGESLAVIARVLERCDAQGFSLGRAQACYARSWPHLWMGRTDAAATDARAAIEIWQGGLERYLPAASYYLGLAELDRGDVESARAALALAGPPERWDGTGMVPFLIGLEAHLMAAAGRPAEAAARHLACGEAIEALMVASPAVFAWRSEAALSLQLTGERDRARELIDTELQMARVTGCPRPIGASLRASGICRVGDRGLAELRESIEVLEGSGADRELALSLTALGAALRRAGERRLAREPLERAISLLATSGARGLIARADTELRAAGGRGRVRAEAGVDSLTASEHRVAELAAAGHTNRHIAGLLQISVKAVEWHLHQSYRKLSIDGRRQLATALSP
jgi:DNA-binding CsgD family transcriptional regulator